MGSVREVVIEILRHGTAHGHLLSPNTRYIALCGSHPAQPLKISLEHHKVLHLLSRMVDQPEASKHEFERNELRALVTELLAQLPALPNEAGGGEETLVHLRLVTTAQELSLLPFELADPPPGLSQSSQPLLIGPQPKVILTREIRRSTPAEVELPSRFRTLVVAADPEDLGLPLSEMLSVLERLTSPFGRPVRCKSTRELVPELRGEVVRVLSRASIEDVREICHREDFSHVHFLAHGVEIPGRAGAFGMLLWDRDGLGSEVVDGRALAVALTPPRADGRDTVPWCVTLATCDSASQANVLAPQMTSIAHDLHEVGIPTVLASQYPLTFGAAVEMTEALYGGEIRGNDIRHTLRDMRHRMCSKMRRTYDWASLAAYAAWPPTLDEKARRIRPLRVVQQLEVANDWGDTAIAALEGTLLGGGRPVSASVARKAGVQALQRLSEVTALLEREVESLRDEVRALDDKARRRRGHWFNARHERDAAQASARVLQVELCGLLGSAWKRVARIRSLLGTSAGEETMVEALRKSAQWYERGAQLDSRSHWVACQAFVQSALLIPPDQRDGRKYESAMRWWKDACVSATNDLELGDSKAVMWAHTTLLEVELWRDMFEPGEKGDPKVHIDGLLRHASPGGFAVRSTRRQLLRYTGWWEPDPDVVGVDGKLAHAVAKLLKPFGDSGPESLRTVDMPSFVEGARREEALAGSRLGVDRVETVSLEKRADADDESSFFRVQMLPARGGDALWIEYGRGGQTFRILVDGGYRKTIRGVSKRIREIARANGGVCRFDLVVVTHVDTDHIEGIIELLGSDLPIQIGDLWYNGRRHLELPAPKRRTPESTLAGKHGHFLDTAIGKLGTPWNGLFDEKAVVLPSDNAPIELDLPGGMRLTLLSPTTRKLKALAPEWDDSVEEAGLNGASYDEVIRKMEKLHYKTDALLGRTKPPSRVDVPKLLREGPSEDGGVENGSSIAFIAEYEGRSILLAGDAHADVLIQSIDKLPSRWKRNGRLRVGAVKLAHHASKNNVSEALLEKLDTQTFLVSTNGERHYHPDQEAIARVVAGAWRGTAAARKKKPVDLLFNYRSDYSAVWDVKRLRDRYHFRTHYPSDQHVLELSPVPEAPASKGRPRRHR